MQENLYIEQSITNIFDLILLQYAIKKNLNIVNILYIVLCSKNKSTISIYNLLCDLIININYNNTN